MEMLRLLISAQIGQHAAGAVYCVHMGRYLLDYAEEFHEERAIMGFVCQQRGDVSLWDDHYVHGPIGVRVMKCEDVVGLGHHAHRYPATQDLIAVEVVRHSSSLYLYARQPPCLC
jgi:hypothetical protein